MEITASSVYDRETVFAIARVGWAKKLRPLTKLFVMGGVCLFFLIACLLIYLLVWRDTLWLWMAAFYGVLIFLNLYLYFIFPRVSLKRLGDMINCKNVFVFRDASVSVVSEAGKSRGESEIEYRALSRAYETSRYIFLFNKSNRAYAIDKMTVAFDDCQQIRNRLIAEFGKKYYICNY